MLFEELRFEAEMATAGRAAEHAAHVPVQPRHRRRPVRAVVKWCRAALHRHAPEPARAPHAIT
jgi:hypothetical protein